MNEKKIAFIICVNDEQEYFESRYYLDRLIIPDEYEKDVLVIQDAPSMTAGYNAGMQSSDAKYKVYMHQDVFIKNPHFIEEMLEVFHSDNNIGMMGMVGCSTLGKDAVAVTAWDKGKIEDNCVQSKLTNSKEDGICSQVQAVDGLLLATQYDIPWREDLFDGWDFYDISQCMEFRKWGYKVVVPYQTEAWCYHDNAYSKMQKYEYYRELFINEYADIGGFFFRKRRPELLAYEWAKELARKEVAELFEMGRKTQLRELFEKPENQGFLYLREYEAIVWIDRMEELHQSQIRFWKPEDNLEQLLYKFRLLKFALKRIEYKTGQIVEEKNFLEENYSSYAVIGVSKWYIKDINSSLL